MIHLITAVESSAVVLPEANVVHKNLRTWATREEYFMKFNCANQFYRNLWFLIHSFVIIFFFLSTLPKKFIVYLVATCSGVEGINFDR